MENNLFKVPIEMFDLDKIKLNKEKNCKVWFRITDKSGDVTDVFTGVLEPSYQSTIALQNKLSELKPYLMKIRKMPESNHANVNITGCVWSGTGEKESFIINGNELSDSEQSMKADTCKVHIQDNNFGYEMEVREIIKEIEVLAHRYLFNNSRAELSFGLSNANDEEEGVEDVEPINED